MNWDQQIVYTKKAVQPQEEKKTNQTEEVKRESKYEEYLDKECKQFLLRTKSGCYLTENYNIKADDLNQNDPKKSTFISKSNYLAFFSKTGKYAVTAGYKEFQIFDCDEKKIIYEENFEGTLQKLCLSNQEKFLVCLTRSKNQLYYVTVYNFNDMKIIKQWEFQQFRKEQWPVIQFDEKDKTCFILKNLHIFEIYDAENNFSLQTSKALKQIDNFYITWQNNITKIIMITLSQFINYKRTQATLKIYNHPNLDTTIFSKDLNQAQEVNLKISPDKNIILLFNSTYHDQTNQSYYGQQELIYFNLQTKEYKNVPTYEGPIYDVQWNSESSHFIVLSGFMPSTAVIFSKECKPIYEFGKNHRNQVIWSTIPKFIALAGFGNLSGEIDIYDSKTFKRLGFCKAKDASVCIFAPDSFQFVTCCLTPRLRVDNNYQVFNYTGKEKAFLDYKHSELYDVIWRPSTEVQQKFLQRVPSASEFTLQQQEEIVKPKKLFRPVGGGEFAAKLRAEKLANQNGRVLNEKEDFGRKASEQQKQEQQQQQQQQKVLVLKPGQTYIPEKKKKNRHKKNKKKQQDDIYY